MTPRPSPNARPRLELLEARDNPTAGAYDHSFGTNGAAALTALNSIVDIAPAADGGAYVLGAVYQGTGGADDPTADFGVVKLTRTGAVDAAFGTAGLATVGFDLQANGRGPDLPARIAVRPDGKIVVAGQALTLASATPASENRAAVALLRTDGTPDPSFNGTGRATFRWAVLGGGSITPVPTGVRELAVLADNRVVLAGSTASNYLIDNSVLSARLTAGGGLDPTYGSAGLAAQPTGFGTRVLGVGVGPDGAVYAAYNTDSAQFSDLYGLRVTPGGALDAAYGAAGKADLGDVGTASSLNTILVEPQADGRLLLAVADVGAALPKTTVTRLRADGTPDPAFGTAGVFVSSGRVSTDDRYVTAEAVAVDADGRILLVGGGPGRTTALRLTPAGAVDAEFGDDGYQAGFGPDESNTILSRAVVAPDGTYLLAGFVAGSDAVVLRVFGDDDQNTPPTVAGLIDRTVAVRGTLFGVEFTVADRESGFDDLTLTVTSSNPDVVPASSLRPNLASPDGTVHRGDFSPITLIVAGTTTITVTATDRVGAQARQSFTLTVGDVPRPVAGPTGGRALAYAATANGQFAASPAATLNPFAGYGGSVRSAVGDVDGDGTPDVVVVTGPGTPVRFAVISGKDNATVLVPPAAPFAGSEGFAGGGFVAAADLDGDGKAEWAVTPDQGGGPRVTVFSLANGRPAVRANFFGIDDPGFRGGARPALGDVNADGTPDLAVAAGFLGGPRTALFDGKTVLATPTRLVSDFFAFTGTDAVTLRNGVFVAAGDLDGDGFAELIFGGGPGGGPRVYALSGKMVAAGDVAGAQAAPVSNFFVAGNDRDRGGVRVGVSDADGDGRADLLAGSGEGSPARVRVYLGKTIAGAAEPGAFQELAPFDGAVIPGGVYVGGAVPPGGVYVG